MFCSNCAKLAILVTRRICIKCHAEVFNSISVICEKCSNTDKICSVCLKKINAQLKQQRYRGCSGCSSRK